jgi:hypothetical protein
VYGESVKRRVLRRFAALWREGFSDIKKEPLLSMHVSHEIVMALKPPCAAKFSVSSAHTGLL